MGEWVYVESLELWVLHGKTCTAEIESAGFLYSYRLVADGEEVEGLDGFSRDLEFCKGECEEWVREWDDD